jgi:cytoskeletal protein CcmA (bactofilin family)
MNARSGNLGAGAISFFRKKAGLNLNGGTVRDTPAQHPAATDPLSIAPSDFRLLPSAEQGQVLCDPFVQGEYCCVGKGCHIIGQAFFEGSIRIDGQVEGTISANGRIAVGQRGTITTSNPIKAAEVIIEGGVRGTIVASKRIEIYASAQVVGDLFAPIIAIEAGAALEGCCSTTPRQRASVT